MSVERWEVFLDKVLNATEEDFQAHYPLFPESQVGGWEIEQRLHLIQSLIIGKDAVETSSSTEEKSVETNERKERLIPSCNSYAKIPLTHPNREVFEGPPIIMTAYGTWKLPNERLEMVEEHRSLPSIVQGQMELPGQLMDTTMLTQLVSRTDSDAICTEFGDTEEEGGVDLQGQLHDMGHLTGPEGGGEDFVQRYLSNIEASLQEVG